MVFTVEEITEIAKETIEGIEKCCQYILAIQTTAWANNNVHRFIEMLDGDVEFNRDKFNAHVIDACQDIAARGNYATV